ncbi:ferritin-like protein [Streptomyces sp. NPDC086549]|uniref:ferritin-like domain-containing protein n=1 Tax=Streptomyces sp. NPDC086549 TaxID=3365752 RepID=UPI0038154834
MSNPTPLKDLKELKAALQLAIGLELSTIPVYLTGLYSIKEGHNTETAQTIRSVVMEEMLHMTLAANVLNALGEVPSVEPVGFKGKHLHPIPSYPLTNPLVSGIGTLQLLPLSPHAVQSYVTIEHPLHGAAKVTEIPLGTCLYRTIGEFYGVILDALHDTKICKNGDFKHHNQVPDTQYYGGAGHVVEVKDRESAVKAIQTIIDEGEGLDPDKLGKQAKTVTDNDRLRNGWQMYSHYARFRELQTGRRFRSTQKAGEEPQGAMVLVDYSAVHPALHVPRNGDTEGGSESAALIEFDLAYTELVDDLYLAFSDGRKPVSYTFHNEKEVVEQKPALPLAVHGMHALKKMAVALMRTPNPASPAHTLCPRFSYVEEGDRDKLRQIVTELRKENR